jgi:S1-C subfamily serine protease
MKKSFIFPLVISLALLAPAAAQSDILLLRPEEREKVDAQTDEFNAAIQPVLTEAAESTVRVWSGNRRLAYGTVIGEGDRILTKWSELARANAPLRVEGADGSTRSATIVGVYPEEDLAVVKLTGETLTPVKWFAESPGLGAFIAAPQPDGRPAAFGVVSVLERNLRETDQAFLGVIGDPGFEGPGVRVDRIAEDSGAAAAGLRPGNVILKVRERPISGLLELKNALVGIAPGTTIPLVVRNGKNEVTIDVTLGNRPALPSFPGDRLRQMERMGGPISRVRDSFARVIQTDMRPQPNQIGGPVVDLQGRVIGITMARADRTRSFVMPAAAIQELLKTDATDPALAQVAQVETLPEIPARRMIGPQRRMVPQGQAGQERLRQHLTEMQRLMDFMREEMDAIEPNR